MCQKLSQKRNTITPLGELDKRDHREASCLKTVQNVHTLQYVYCVEICALCAGKLSAPLCLIACPENPPDKDNKQRNIQKAGERLYCFHPPAFLGHDKKYRVLLLNFNPEIRFKIMKII